jgi:nitrate reductase gamma subunit
MRFFDLFVHILLGARFLLLCPFAEVVHCGSFLRSDFVGDGQGLV